MAVRAVTAVPLLLILGCGGPAQPLPEMVQVPAGDFLMGCDLAVDPLCRTTEIPPHAVTLSAFEIDRTELTQFDFAGCTAADVCGLPGGDESRPDLPVRFVEWWQADAYCAWVGKRLPTEAEWEKAARGTDGRIYPWGNEAPTCDLAAFNVCPPNGQNKTDPVGSHPAGASPYGAEDMSGNVVEWVSDWWDPAYYQASPATDPQGPASGTVKVGRGGCVLANPSRLRVTARETEGSAGVCGLGFRCARSL